MKTKATVAKALTPEEKAILGNIRSLLDQMESEAPAQPEEDEMVMNAKKNEEFPPVQDEEEEEEVTKASKPEEIANNGATQRTTVSDSDVDNALSILKCYLGKSAPRKATVMKSLINEVAQIRKENRELRNAVEGILDGFNFERRPAPISKSSRDALAELVSMVQKSQKHNEVDGDLSDVMQSLFM